MNIHGLMKGLRPLFLDSGHIDMGDHNWSVTGVPSEILGETLSPFMSCANYMCLDPCA